jgi:hypothetical protein
MVKMVLLQSYPALFAVEHRVDPTPSELDVEIRRVLVKDISFELWLNIFFPNIFGIDVQIVLEAFGDDDTAREFGMKLSRYC